MGSIEGGPHWGEKKNYLGQKVGGKMLNNIAEENICNGVSPGMGLRALFFSLVCSRTGAWAEKERKKDMEYNIVSRNTSNVEQNILQQS